MIYYLDIFDYLIIVILILFIFEKNVNNFIKKYLIYNKNIKYNQEYLLDEILYKE
jgi:hypothetical protein